jgi:selenide,water dikinase
MMARKATISAKAEDARHLVLVGGGHAHVHVLKSFAMRPEPGVRLTLISPQPYATYSGMVPGVLSGQYEVSEAQIDLRSLAARAKAAFIGDRVVQVDPRARMLFLQERPSVSYDLLSFDIGSMPADQERILPGANIIRVKPIEEALAGIEEAFASPVPEDGRRIVVVGAGAGGVEIAFGLSARVRREGKGSVTICDREAQPFAGRGPRTASVVEETLRRKEIRFIGGVEVASVDSAGVHLADGRLVPADVVVWSTGARGPALFSKSLLPMDERGCLRVGDDLRQLQFPELFAAGDCASIVSHPNLPKAGVHAVRQGPVLAANLRAALRGKRLRTFRPQSQFLSLLNTGDGSAIFSWGQVALRHSTFWHLKNYIDRRFVERYGRPGLAAKTMKDEPMVCGGCAAKVSADVLERVLSQLEVSPSEGVIVGLEEGDDAAVFAQPPGTLAVATVDAFPPFSDDLYLVGQVAATNAASDLYAMGAEGCAAIALVSLPHLGDRDDEERLTQFMRGAIKQLEQMNVPLVGGHTLAGDQMILGFSMHGWVKPGELLRKEGARPGDQIVLTKPLGTGVILAAARAGVAPAEWVEGAHAWMLHSNGPAMRLLRDHGVHACTDVTGFGLGGHLTEILRSSEVGARLYGSKIPALRGVQDLLGASWRSSFHAANERAQRRAHRANPESPAFPLCFDPQTSGGLLAAVPPDVVDDLCAAANEAGETFYVIGEFVQGAPQWELEK